jgi:hypothetical protein
MQQGKVPRYVVLSPTFSRSGHRVVTANVVISSPAPGQLQGRVAQPSN